MAEICKKVFSLVLLSYCAKGSTAFQDYRASEFRKFFLKLQKVSFRPIRLGRESKANILFAPLKLVSDFPYSFFPKGGNSLSFGFV